MQDSKVTSVKSCINNKVNMAIRSGRFKRLRFRNNRTLVCLLNFEKGIMSTTFL